jgi:hypothetical protein
MKIQFESNLDYQDRDRSYASKYLTVLPNKEEFKKLLED